MNKNWRVTYFDLPFEQRKTPQDFMPHEDRLNNYDEAEEKALMLEKSPNAYDVKITVWNGDACIEEMK